MNETSSSLYDLLPVNESVMNRTVFVWYDKTVTALS